MSALAADAEYATSGTLWAATTERVMQSRDRGQSWLPIAGLPDGVPLMALDAAPGRLRAVVLGGSVWDAALAPAT